jgi:hypothetical protein
MVATPKRAEDEKRNETTIEACCDGNKCDLVLVNDK